MQTPRSLCELVMTKNAQPVSAGPRELAWPTRLCLTGEWRSMSGIGSLFLVQAGKERRKRARGINLFSVSILSSDVAPFFIGLGFVESNCRGLIPEFSIGRSICRQDAHFVRGRTSAFRHHVVWSYAMDTRDISLIAKIFSPRFG
jgi:hypothetical protein